MAKTMAEVLAEHPEPEVDGSYWYCPCGHDYGVTFGCAAVAAHQAAALSAAGFGPVNEARDLQQIADVIMTRVVYAGNEGWTLTAEDRDDHEYAHCLDAAQEIIDRRTQQ